MTIRGNFLSGAYQKPPRKWLAGLGILTAGVLLAGCSSMPKIPFVKGPKERVENSGQTPQPAAPPLAVAAPLPAAPPAPPAPFVTEEELLGLPGPELDRVLGAAVFTTRQGRGELRRYANKSCNLIVILYPVERSGAVAKTIEATSFFSSAARPELQPCLNGFDPRD